MVALLVSQGHVVEIVQTAAIQRDDVFESCTQRPRFTTENHYLFAPVALVAVTLPKNTMCGLSVILAESPRGFPV